MEQDILQKDNMLIGLGGPEARFQKGQSLLDAKNKSPILWHSEISKNSKKIPISESANGPKSFQILSRGIFQLFERC